ncbi:MAG: MFS transporter [Candidatus Lokiarchaeota archaeon]|nr:MFS transporter [Candidatus Lokiarchaeota archaeon]MBD3340508.1 MFS transporter [Candidatus Lokiarchaeota archaeon]
MKEQIAENSESRHPTWKYASNATFQFTVTILTTTVGVFLFFYYEAVLGLNAWLIFLALSIWTVYDAINDPLIGYLVDTNTKLTKRFGRRFPWIVIGIVPWCLSLFLVYTAPDINAATNPWPIFFWLLISLIIFDTFGTLVNVNIQALRPDLFRTEDERRKLSSFYMPIDMIAIALGLLLPPLFLGGGTGREAFAFMGAMIAVIAIVSAILFIPGAREDKVVIERYYTEEYERMSFFKGMKEVIKQKSFITYFIMLTCFLSATNLLLGNAIYLTTFVIQADPDTVTIIFAIFLLGALVSVPFWIKLLKIMQNNKKLITIGGISISIMLFPISFFVTLVDLLIMMFILGFCLGSMWAFIYTIIQANVVDDYVVRTKKNQKAILIGVSVFLQRLAATIDELLIAVVHEMTGFVAGQATYSELASATADIALVLWGIRLLSGVIPGLIMLLGTLIFWKYYPLTQDIVIKNKEELLKLGF